MATGFFKVPTPHNEPVKTYAPGSAERKELQAKLKEMRAEVRDIPMFIGDKEVRDGKKTELRPPY
jgi:1-pyrroline-5-carboxylate dehydrogenase